MKRNRLFTGILTTMAILLLATSSCTRYDDPPPYFEEELPSSVSAKRKVLIIGIDGAVGKEYKAIKPTVLEGLKAHSKYSYDAVSDVATTDAASWKTLLTGVSYDRHQIHDSTFIYTQPSDANQHGSIANYPNLFSYILSSAKSDLNTSFITPWGNMVNRLTPEVEDKVVAASDAAVKDSTILRLKNPNSDLVVVHFNGVAIAGKEHGFSASSAGYKAAVEKVDGYIGELMAALKSRPEYNKLEEWLVIIAGTHGGKDKSYGGFSAEETNVISFYYNDNFQPKEVVKAPFTGIRMTGRDAAAVKAVLSDDGGLYNVGTAQQTIQIKIKGTAGAYPHFFSKMERWPSTPGWSMFTGGSAWAISIRSTTSGEVRHQPGSPNVFDNNWHTLTVVFADSANKWWLRRYTDGIRHDDRDITSLKNSAGAILSSAPLTIGWGADPAYTSANIFTADAMIFNTALTDAEVRENVCLTDITKHPRYNNLIGYWPCNEGLGRTFKNLAPGATSNFNVSGPAVWNTETPHCAVPTGSGNSDAALRLVRSTDVATTIFYWLKIPVATNWNLEGAKWLEEYETEFVKL